MTDIPFGRSGHRPYLAPPWVWLTAIAAVPAVCAWLLAGLTGVVMTALLVGGLMAVIPNLSPATVMRMFRARPIAPWDAPELKRMVRELGRRAGLDEPPALYWLPEQRVNAFSTGDARRSAIALSDMTLRVLSPTQMSCVLAHEMSHVTAGDTGSMRVAAALAQVTQLVTLLGLFAILSVYFSGGSMALWIVFVFAFAPTAVTLLRLAFSRDREYAADLFAARLTGDAPAVAETLQHIDALSRRGWAGYMGDLAGAMPRWLSTHPPTGERVRRLMALADSGDGGSRRSHHPGDEAETPEERRRLS
ncbi:MAG: M48 family metalloprotease [Alphaproteobacteria bacterium]|jgi:heat shock protein HtpX|nr:M48 family metalloprotease [Alphaproteobacteria bacterium]